MTAALATLTPAIRGPRGPRTAPEGRKAPETIPDLAKPAPSHLDWALKYASLGFAVFPLKPRSKEPATPKGFHDATTDEGLIDAWWRAMPKANIGIAIPENMIVVDIDGPEAMKTLEARGLHLPETATVITAHGSHRWYTVDRRVKRQIKALADLDILADGFVVAPPSIHPSGDAYGWATDMNEVAEAPAWVYDLEREPTADQTAPPAAGGIPVGQRNATLASLAGSMRRRGMTETAICAALIVENREKCNPPLPEHEVRAIATSVSRYSPMATAQPMATTPAGEDLATFLGVRTLDTVSTDPPPPLLVDRLDPTGHTILYGAGGVGKGTYASHLICELAKLGHRVLILDYENHPGEWARRIHGLGGLDAATGVSHVSPLAPAWQGQRGALWDQAEDLKRIVAEGGFTFLVIDSIVPALGGADAGTGSTEAAAKYDAALQYIGLPALSLGHVSRNTGLTYPFGSVFWHNFARLTWSLEPADDGVSVLLKNRKHNNYPQQPDQLVTVTWTGGLPRDVFEKRRTVAIAEAITEVLAETPNRSPAEIAETLNADLGDDASAYKINTIRHTLRRGLEANPPRYALSDGRWSNVV